MENSNMNETLKALNLEELGKAAGGAGDRPPEFYQYSDYVASLFKRYNIPWGKWNQLKHLLTPEENARLRELEAILLEAEQRRKINK